MWKKLGKYKVTKDGVVQLGEELRDFLSSQQEALIDPWAPILWVTVFSLIRTFRDDFLYSH